MSHSLGPIASSLISHTFGCRSHGADDIVSTLNKGLNGGRRNKAIGASDKNFRSLLDNGHDRGVSETGGVLVALPFTGASEQI